MNSFIKRFFPFVTVILLPFVWGFVSRPQSSTGNVRFVRCSTLMGLSSNSQKCVAQDKEGFIWVGTVDGLNRFDGYSFKVYRKNAADTSSIRSNLINCLYTDSKGTLWVGTYGGGLSRYNKEADNFSTYHEFLSKNDNINSITEDIHMRLWVGTTLGLYMLDANSNRFIRYLRNERNPFDTKTIAYNEVDRIVADNDLLWIAYSTGMLSALNTTSMTFKHYKLFDVSSPETADFSVNSLVPDSGSIWISTWSKGIWVFDKASGISHPYDKERNRYVNFIFKDSQNRLWYSPEYDGLVMIDGKEKATYRKDDFDKNSVSSNLLSNICQDQEGNLWITSKLGDLNCVIPDSPFRNWHKNPTSENGLTSELIYTVIEDSKNRIWIGYEDGGIDILDAKNVRPKVHIEGGNSSGLGPGPVMDIFESRNGTIWVGKYLDGLREYNEKTKSFRSFKHIEGDDKSIAGNDVRYISEDSHGNLWVALHGAGVDMYDPKDGVFIHHKHDDQNPSSTILSDWTFTALCDRNDNIWVSTVAGVSVISENTPTVRQYSGDETDQYDLSNSLAYIVFIDSRNCAWIGTADGLNELDPKTGIVKKYFTSDGLPSNLIIDVLEDNNHDIWISTTNGLSRFRTEEGSFKNFSIQDGLATNEFNKLASFKNQKGEMYFGGRGGLTRFNPASIRANNYIPPVYFTEFKLFNQPVRIATGRASNGSFISQQPAFCNEVKLEHNQNEITVGFTALNFLSPEKNQYKYELEGFDSHWSFAGYKREVTYTNLDPGEYTFKVIASNNDGVWNTNGASLKIIVMPPFWKTKWAYVVYFSFIVFLLYVFRRFTLHEAEVKRRLELEELEIEKLHEMDLLKMQFFANVSHEFRTPLTLIAGPIERLLHDVKDELQRVQLKLVSRNANRLLRLINQLMDFRKSEEAQLELNLTRSDIVHFVRDIVDTFSQEALQRNIQFTFRYSHVSYEVLFDTDKLDKIIYNLLSNAFKCTHDGGTITVSLDLDGTTVRREISNHGDESELLGGKTLKISVKDSGIGIPKDAQARIFDRFYQVKNNLMNQGTGIGLSLTYELVKLHRGSIIVESEPDKGSEFTITLPAWLSESDLPQLSPPSAAGKQVNMCEKEIRDEEVFGDNDATEEQKLKDGLPKILTIEDNADMRLFIKNEFGDNYNVCEARDGTMGLQIAFEEIPDVIICDVMMPGKDGYEVCRTLKNDERTSHIPVVMLTARGSEQHTLEGFESGADDYVAKPFSSAVLKARIKNLIEARNSLRRKFMKEPFAALAEISPSKTDVKLFQKVCSVVEKNLNNPNFDVNNFAAEIGMSRTQLYRKIHALSGESVKEFIRVIRLKKAAELLVTTDDNVSEVAYSVGFNSLSYFTTSFTEYFGMNPTKFIEKHSS